MANCPCCSNRMLRHIRHHQVYWFCRSCWQEMPLIEQKPVSQKPVSQKSVSQKSVSQKSVSQPSLEQFLLPQQFLTLSPEWVTADRN
jgi:hypothetical protein